MKYNHILVVDLEATCYQDGDEDKPANWTVEHDQEVTEIGAVLYDLASGHITARKSFLIQPYGPMGKFCEELTGLTKDKVKYAPGFTQSLSDLKNWCNSRGAPIKEMPWASWGDYDRIQIERQCSRNWLISPFGREHINLKGMFSILTDRRKGVGVSKALRIMKTEFEGTPHRGLDDAIMVARIMEWMFNIGA